MALGFPSPLGVSYFQILFQIFQPHCLPCFRPLSGYLISKLSGEIKVIGYYCFRPLSGYLISKLAVEWEYKKDSEAFPSPLGVSYFQIKESYILGRFISFRPLSGYLISKSCPPEPAILLAFLTLLRGKSFSCIFFLYLTYTIASKCSIYAVRGKIIFFLINCCTYLF